jgi:hypothetical protein
MSKPKFTGTRSNQGNSNGSWLKPGGGSQLRGRPDSKLRGLVRSTRTSWISRLNSPPGPNRVSMPDEPVRPDGRPWQRSSEGSTADFYDKVCRRNRHPLILTVSGDPNKLLPELSGRSGPEGGPRVVLPFRDLNRT